MKKKAINSWLAWGQFGVSSQATRFWSRMGLKWRRNIEREENQRNIEEKRCYLLLIHKLFTFPPPQEKWKKVSLWTKAWEKKKGDQEKEIETESFQRKDRNLRNQWRFDSKTFHSSRRHFDTLKSCSFLSNYKRILWKF